MKQDDTSKSLPLGEVRWGSKQELRKYIREQKRAHTAEELAAMSQQVCAAVLSTTQWHEATTILLYHSLPDEVDTRQLIDAATNQGKRVLLPVVVGDDLELRLYTGKDSLRQGSFGILEPCGEIFSTEDYGTIDLAIIPGMAFDTQGNRLGRGKGYYDRLLPRLSSTLLIGICFPFQMLESIPAEQHDIPMHYGISTRFMHFCTSGWLRNDSGARP